MPASVKVADQYKVVADCKVKVGGEWKTVSVIKAKVAGDWKTVYSVGSPPSPPPPPGPDFTVSISPNPVTGSRSADGAVTSGSAATTLANGTGPYTYLWERVSGSTFTITSPTASSTTFSTSLSNGESKSGVYKVTVTDTDDSKTATNNVTVNMVSTYVPPAPPPPPSLSGSVSPSSVSGSRSGAGSATTGSATASGSGGTGSYSYSWSGGGCTPNNPSSATTTFSYTLSNGQSISFTGTCTISDTGGNSVSRNVSINFNSTYVAPALSAYASPSSVYGYGTRGTINSGSTTVVASGGTAPYTYSWTPTTGSEGVFVNSPNSATTSFSRFVGPIAPEANDTFYCTVTDAVGAQVQVSCNCFLQWDGT